MRFNTATAGTFNELIKRFLDRDLAVKDAVEILRLVVAEPRRCVHQPGIGGNDARSQSLCRR